MGLLRGIGGLVAAPMIGGMITAPLLSMFVLPAAYMLMLRRRRAGRTD